MWEQHTSAFGKKDSNLGETNSPRSEKIKVNKKVSELVLVNIHAPHMDTRAKSPEITGKFNDKTNILTDSIGKDLCVLDDFNGKLGKKDTKLNCIDLHSRCIRIINGEHLCDLMKNNRISSTTYKHRACHITTFQPKTVNTFI